MTHAIESVPSSGAGVGHGPGAGGRRGMQSRPPLPERAPGIELLGVVARSGQRRAPSLARRSDGQMIQLTPLLYAVLETADGRRTYEEIGDLVGDRIGRHVTAEDVRFLVEQRLRPLGVLRSADGSVSPPKKANPLLALRLRFVVSDPKVTSRVAAPFTLLFRAPVVFAFVTVFLVSTGWLFFERGLGGATRDLLYRPGVVLLVFALTLLSAGFHELGHAAACRYGGATPGAMGVGLYLIWPAFYTDVTDAYRLDRRGRLRVDLGGIYFNVVFAVAAFGLWAATGWEALLVMVPLQLLQIVRQLAPLVRLDGYHILADLTGVPDLFAHMRPILLGMLPWRREPRARALRPWVRVAVTAWVLLVLPLLLAAFAAIVLTFPRVAATAWDSALRQGDSVLDAWRAGEIAASALHVLSILALILPVVSMSYLIGRVGRRTVRRVWRGTSGRPVARGLALLVASSLVAVLAAAWWPDGQYRPIGPGDTGAVDIRFRELPLVDRLVALNEESTMPAMSNAYAPAPVLLLDSGSDGLPRPASAPSSLHPGTSSGRAADLPSGGYRFTPPASPRDGDNQALAINYEDGSSLIDIALSLVFDDDGIVDGRNEAHALASCVACVTVAIAFQVVLIIDEAADVRPENVAVAVNAQCMKCMTYALAIQLVFTLTEPLSSEAMAELDEVWKRLEAISANIENIPLDRLRPMLLDIEKEILAILADHASGSSEGLVEAQSSSGEGKPVPGVSPSPTSEPSPEPSPQPTPEPTPEPSPSPSPSPQPSPSPTATPTP